MYGSVEICKTLYQSNDFSYQNPCLVLSHKFHSAKHPATKEIMQINLFDTQADPVPIQMIKTTIYMFEIQ